jgi:hypothetical protein
MLMQAPCLSAAPGLDYVDLAPREEGTPRRSRGGPDLRAVEVSPGQFRAEADEEARCTICSAVRCVP